MDGSDDALVEEFWALSRKLRSLAGEALAAWDVTPSQARAVSVLRRSGPVRLRELAGRLRIAPRSATEVVDGLQERGLVERRSDPGDRRATLVALTEDGEHVAAGIRAARASGAGNVFARLPDADRTELARLLTALRAAADDPAVEAGATALHRARARLTDPGDPVN